MPAPAQAVLGQPIVLYDAYGNPLPVLNATSAPAGTTSGMPIIGLDGGTIARIARIGEFGTQRTTSEVMLWHDAFESSTVNAFWTQSTTTQTIAQATGVLTLNNSNITTLNTDSIITSQRQFPKYPRNPLYCRFRANITANVAANHTLVEFGFGAPAGVTAIINNGAFYRWTAAGNLNAVISYNGTEQSTQVLAQGTISTTEYYYYDIIVDDDFVRFVVSDSSGLPVVDTQVSITNTVAYIWAVSHSPSFARVYVDATGGGTAIQLKLAAHSVQALDNLFSMPWGEQQGASLRHGLISPTTYAATQQTVTVITGVTPSNTAVGAAFLGGEATLASTATSENGLAVFSFQIPSPYSYFLKRVYIPPPVLTTALTTTAGVMEWFLIHNSTNGIVSSGGGNRLALGVHGWLASAAAGTAASGGVITWQPDTPLVCLPGTWIVFGYKMISGTTTGVLRAVVTPDGYWM